MTRASFLRSVWSPYRAHIPVARRKHAVGFIPVSIPTPYQFSDGNASQTEHTTERYGHTSRSVWSCAYQLCDGNTIAAHTDWQDRHSVKRTVAQVGQRPAEPLLSDVDAWVTVRLFNQSGSMKPLPSVATRIAGDMTRFVSKRDALSGHDAHAFHCTRGT
jgi:hypothetical protein